MASPQCEDGYCKLANELLEAIASAPICGEQFRVMMAIIRKTYGYGKKSDTIALSQLQAISKLPRQSVCRALNGLKKANMITSHQNATRTPSTYAVQKDWEKWVPSHHIATTSHQDATSPSHHIATNLVTKLRPSKDNIQKTNKRQKTYSASDDAVGGNGTRFFLTRKRKKLTGKRLDTFEQFWNAFDYKKGKAEAADSWLSIPTLTDSIVDTIITAAKREASERPTLIAAGKTPKMAQGWITARRWEDEVVEMLSWEERMAQSAASRDEILH